MTAAFERAVDFILDHEGLGTNDPDDRGGITRWGISSRAYPDLNIDRLTRDQAIELYHRDYWLPIQGDALPAPLGLALFDHAVHSGVVTAVRSLQFALGFHGDALDGIVGPKTLALVNTLDTQRLLRSILHERAQRLIAQSDLPGQKSFTRGWVNRVIDLALEVGKA